MWYLLKKARRDLWKLKGQFIAVLLMTFLCIMVFSGIEGLWKSMDVNSKNYFEDSNLADAWINGLTFTDEDLCAVKSINEIKEADLLTTVDALSIINNQEADLKVLTFDSNSVSRLYIKEGREFDKNTAGCWLDSFYADAMKINVGDSIFIEKDGNRIEIEVVGIVMNPEYIGYTGPASTTPTNHAAYGYAVLDNNTFKNLTQNPIMYNQIRITYEKKTNLQNIREHLEDVLGKKMLSYVDRDTNGNIVYFTSKITQVKKISFLFSAIFLLLALLTIYSTISRLVSTQNVQIGTLAAMGFSRKQILIHYANYGFVISSIGVLCGYFSSYFLSNMLIASQKKFHAMPNWHIPISSSSFILIILVIVICTLAALSASYKFVSNNPANAIKNQVVLREDKRKVRDTSILSFEWKWVIRDLSRTKLRFLIGIIGVLGSMVLLISAWGLRDSVEYSNKYVYGEQFSYTKKLGITSNAKLDEIEALDHNGQWIEETSAEIRINAQVETTNLNIIDKGEYVTIWPEQEENLNNEKMVLSKKFAERLDINENDEIEIKAMGSNEFKKYTVSKIVNIPFPQGIYCSKKYWEEQGNTYQPTSFLTKENINKSHHDDIVSEITISAQLESTNDIMKSVLAILLAMIVASILLSTVILYNLGLLSFTEKIRQYATLKVLGFRNSELFKIIFYNSIPSLVIGGIIGIIVGINFMKIFVTLISTNVRGYISYLTVINVLLSVIFVFVCTLTVDYIVYKKVKKLNMVEVLKSVE